jgi:Holliday junction DNA helicase RuvA
MIATLTGTIDEKVNDMVILNIGGVGYGLFVIPEDYERMSPGQSTKLYIYEHIREQSNDLFGFLRLDTKGLFEQLLGVSGIGPKMALNVLSIGSSDAVRLAIATGDVKFICQAQGVGKRVAERIVVDLKNKVGLESIELSATGLLQSEDQLLKDEAIEALVSLGYSLQDAMSALKAVDKSLSSQERVKLALKGGK